MCRSTGACGCRAPRPVPFPISAPGSRGGPNGPWQPHLGGDVPVEPIAYWPKHRFALQVALQQEPYAGYVREVLRLAVPLPKPGEEADDLAVPLGGKNRGGAQ